MRFVGFVLVLVSAAAARADIGYLPVTFEEPEPHNAADHKQRMEATLARLPATLVACAREVDNKCLESAAAATKRDIAEIAAVRIRSEGGAPTHVRLRVYGRGPQPGDWVVAFQTDRDVTHADALDVTQGMLAEAFAPATFGGTANIRGAPADAELLVDGLPVARNGSDQAAVRLRPGHHLLEVHPLEGRPLGSARPPVSVDFDVFFDAITDVDVPAAPAPLAAPAGAPWAWDVALGTAIVGGVAALAGVITNVAVVGSQVDQWNARASQGGQLGNSEDPACNSFPHTCAQSRGWTVQYGGDSPTEPARFMMVAYSRDNELKWRVTSSTLWATAVAGALAAVGGGVATFMLWPSASEDAPAAAEPEAR